MNWRPFETAPEDGRLILVWRKDAGVFVAIHRPCEDEPDGDWLWWDAVSGEDLAGDLPAFWMPMPEGVHGGD